MKTSPIGKIYGRLKVIEFSHYDAKHRKHYLCLCECGETKTVQISLLSGGNTRSCGCLGRESRANKRLPNDVGVINQIILGYKRHAKDREIAWHLTRDEVDDLVRQPCHYCGDPAGNLKKTKNHPGFAHNGIDRLNSDLPYTAGNVVAACGFCNKAKASATASEFVEWARRVAEQWGGYALDMEKAA